MLLHLLHKIKSTLPHPCELNSNFLMFSHVTKKPELKNAPLVFFLHAFNAMSLLVVSSLLGFLLSEVNSAAVSLYSCAGEQALTSCIVAPPAYFSCVF